MFPREPECRLVSFNLLPGSWEYEQFTLIVDHIQSDPYAPPSKLRLKVTHDVAKFPPDLFSNATR